MLRYLVRYFKISILLNGKEQPPQPRGLEPPGPVNRLKILTGSNVQRKGRQATPRLAGLLEQTQTQACPSSCLQPLETSTATHPAPRSAGLRFLRSCCPLRALHIATLSQ